MFVVITLLALIFDGFHVTELVQFQSPLFIYQYWGNDVADKYVERSIKGSKGHERHVLISIKELVSFNSFFETNFFIDKSNQITQGIRKKLYY